MPASDSVPALVFLDPHYPGGRIADPDKPQLRVNDLGVSRGDGIFETMLVMDGAPLKEEAHLARLQSSAALLELQIPAEAAWAAAIRTAIETAHGGQLSVKLVATRGVDGTGTPTCWVYATPVSPAVKDQRGKPISVLLLDRGYEANVSERAPWLLLGAKTLSYAINMAALRYAHAQGADDVIFTSSDGKVLEGPTSTVLVARVENGRKRLTTPLLESGVLAGTTQAALFAAAKDTGWELGYGPLVPEDLFASDGVWLASSLRLLAPIGAIDGKVIPVNAELGAELNALMETVRG